MPARGHLETEALLEWLEGRAAPAAAARAESHVAGCARCAAEREAWARLLGTLEADRTPGPPESVVRRAVALYAGYEAPPTLVQRLFATLVFDSRRQTALAGVRDRGASAVKLLGEAADVTVDLLCEPAGDGWRVSGQVIAERQPELGWEVEARGDGGAVQARCDRFGEFVLDGLPNGRYVFALRDLEREVLLPEVELP